MNMLLLLAASPTVAPGVCAPCDSDVRVSGPLPPSAWLLPSRLYGRPCYELCQHRLQCICIDALWHLPQCQAVPNSTAPDASDCLHTFYSDLLRPRTADRPACVANFFIALAMIYDGNAPATLPTACSRDVAPPACCFCADTDTMANVYFDDDEALRAMLGDNVSPSFVANMVQGLAAQEEAKFLTVAIFVPSLVNNATIPGLEDTEVQVVNCTTVVRAALKAAGCTSKCTDLARPRTGGAPFAAERRLMVTPLSAWEGRKRRFAYRILR